MASHTTTGEWKSFELRMRRRRAERLVLRAQLAAEAGYAEDARLSLAEARQLDPRLPTIDAVEETLDRLPAPPAPAPTRRWRGAAIVAATLAAVAFAVSLRPHPIVPAYSLQTLLLEPPAVTDPRLDPIAPAPPPPQPQLRPKASATPMTKATTSPMPAVAPLGTGTNRPAATPNRAAGARTTRRASRADSGHWRRGRGRRRDRSVARVTRSVAQPARAGAAGAAGEDAADRRGCADRARSLCRRVQRARRRRRRTRVAASESRRTDPRVRGASLPADLSRRLPHRRRRSNRARKLRGVRDVDAEDRRRRSSHRGAAVDV